MSASYRGLCGFLACGFLLSGIALVCAAEEKDKPPGKVRLYIGTYTWKASKGIYLSRLDPATGALEAPVLAGAATNPSFLAIHASGRFLYAVGEVDRFGGQKGGVLSAFAIDRQSGKLTLLNQHSSRGPGPCHVAVDRTGRWALVANYSGGSVACLPIQPDGRLGEATDFVQHKGSSVNPQRQQGPHAHAAYFDAANRFVFVPDLGLDKVMIYRFDAAHGKLVPNDPAWVAMAPGAGPRHLAFHPNGRYAYVINEINSTVTALAYDAARGTLKPLESVSTLPEGFEGKSTTAEVAIHPSGKFLYGSNRGHDSIAAFAIDAETGKLRPIGHEPTQGKSPRNFAMDPTGTYLLAANQDTGNVVVFRIDAQSGKLQATGHSIQVAAPVCVEFVAAGKAE
jgi:6-phosphogluconolactonase